MAKSKGRAANEGSIFQRKRPSGALVWVGVIPAGWRADGKRRRRTVYGATQAEVVEKLAELRREAAAGPLADPGKLTVGDLCDRYLEAARRDVRGTTAALYTKALALHVRPSGRIGGARLAKLTPLHLLHWLATLEREQVGPRMQQVAFDVLKRALAFGVDTGLLARNPAARVKRPKAPRPEVKALSAEQTRALLRAAEQAEPWVETSVALLLSGLRAGECFALSWGDCEAGAVHVRRGLVEVDGERRLTEPKTKTSKRRVPLPGFATRALHRYRNSLAAAPLPGVLLFSAPDGGPVWVGNYRRRAFARVVKAAGLPASVTPHKLRHTCATVALGAGADVRSVAALLGHERASITLDVYAHAIPERVAEAVAKLERAL